MDRVLVSLKFYWGENSTGVLHKVGSLMIEFGFFMWTAKENSWGDPGASKRGEKCTTHYWFLCNMVWTLYLDGSGAGNGMFCYNFNRIWFFPALFVCCLHTWI